MSRSSTTSLSRLIVVLLFWLTLAPFVRSADLVERHVESPPDAIRQQLGLRPFYKKCVDCGGLAILGSDKPSDYALLEAAYLVDHLLAGRDDIRAAIVRNKIRLAVMACGELTTEVPEHSDLRPSQYWDRRARGLGATRERPAGSCAEENLLGFRGDPYLGENIMIHEFAHVIHLMGVNSIDPKFDGQLAEAYRHALSAGLWKKTYAATNKEEYWAEGVQSWFHCNRVNSRDHNDINTRAQLKEYDPDLARLLASVFRDNDWVYMLPKDRPQAEHLTGFTLEGSPTFSWPAALSEWYKKYEAEHDPTLPPKE